MASLSSVWVVARAALRRRRGQTLMTGLIVMLCTATMLVGLALLLAVTGPFDRTFAQLNGAHATVMFDAENVTPQQVAATAQAAGVTAAAGPFPVAMATLEMTDGPGFTDVMRVVGRADPGGTVDKLALTHGRWPTGPHEMALSSTYRFGPDPAGGLGRTYRVPHVGTVTVVGIAYSVTNSGDAWMLPENVRVIGQTGYEMAYRFDPASAATAEQMTARTAAVTGSLPPGAVTGTTSYLTLRDRAGQSARTISTFLTVFAVLSLVVAVLVIGNVVSGAVIAGFRSIGVLKAVGFAPGQVSAVFLLMMVGPGVIGSAAGAVLGDLGARWMLGQFADNSYVLGLDTAPALWLHAVAVAAIVLLVALTALAPALRAGRQSATTALSARTGQTGRGRSIQRRLSRSALPRAVSLGLALPVVRPARSLLTLVAIVLGSVTVVFATGLLTSAGRWDEALARRESVQVAVHNPPPGGPQRSAGEDRRQPQGTVMSDPQVESFLRGLSGARYVTATRAVEVAVGGTNEKVMLQGHRGDSAHLGYRILSGRWFAGAGEAVAGRDILRLSGKAIGDSLTLHSGDGSVTVKLVGEVFGGEHTILVDEATLPPAAGKENMMYQYLVGLAEGVDPQEFIDRVADGGNAGLIAGEPDDEGIALLELIVVIGTLTTLLVAVAALGVAHTVVLNTRERRRDLAIAKAVGMTPGQVVIMAVTSMAVLGLIGGVIGLPGGVAAQRFIIGLIGESEETGLPQSIVDVYRGMDLGALLLCGVVIAVIGALLPARGAARVSTAEALHTE